MAYDAWDAEKIYGCLCDEGYTGHNCDLRTCPTGDDLLTTLQVNEVQYVKCSIENNLNRRTGQSMKRTPFPAHRKAGGKGRIEARRCEEGG